MTLLFISLSSPSICAASLRWTIWLAWISDVLSYQFMVLALNAKDWETHTYACMRDFNPFLQFRGVVLVFVPIALTFINLFSLSIWSFLLLSLPPPAFWHKSQTCVLTGPIKFQSRQFESAGGSEVPDYSKIIDCFIGRIFGYAYWCGVRSPLNIHCFPGSNCLYEYQLLILWGL